MTVAIVPVKALSKAKSRLASKLSEGERRKLVLWCLSRVSEALQGCPEIDRIAVVSSDPDLKRFCVEHNLVLVAEHREGLNEALEDGLQWAVGVGADRLLVCHADLPYLSSVDVSRMIARSGSSAVVLAPDRFEVGTNLIFYEPPGCLPFRFGRESFKKHRDEAKNLGLKVEVYSSLGTSFDLDTLQDLEEVGKGGAYSYYVLSGSSDRG